MLFFFLRGYIPMQKTLFVSAVVSGTSLLVGMLGIASAEAATLTHLYNLNGTLADSLGGPSLESNGGTIGAGGYTFAANQGPSLSGAVNSAAYSILMDFSIEDTNSYKKLIDFKDRASDSGVYNFNTSLVLYNVTSGLGGVFVPNALARLVVTRSSTNNFVGYVNGVQQFTIGVAPDFATVSSNIVHFLRDDFATSQSEATSGLLTKIAIYDDALTGQEVAGLGGVGYPIAAPVTTSVPTPALLPGLIGLGLGVVRRRKAAKSA
jgi:hypothetical protein